MRFIHTADWHLGRSLHNVRLLDDQRYVLDQLVALVRDARPDALLLAGDLYDRATPPGDAIDALDDTLCAILEMGVTVIAIAGNHDGPHLINYGSRLFAARGLHTFGKVASTIGCVPLTDQWGAVHVYALPYAEPLKVGEQLGDESITSHDAALRGWATRALRDHPAGARAIAVAHAFVIGGIASDSERPIIGGATNVDAGCFEGFHYIALGHLHRPQAIGARIHYAGSILKYAFDEADHVKSVNLVELDGEGNCQVAYIPLTPRRDMRRIEGFFADVLRDAPSDPRRDDYLSIRLLDDGPLLEPMRRLSAYYPNLLETPRVGLNASTIGVRHGLDHRLKRTDDLFAFFFEQMTGAALSDAEADVLAEALARVRRQETEVIA